MLRGQESQLLPSKWEFVQTLNPLAAHLSHCSIIAITGLDGHAYGSWRGKGNSGRMWLRDFLSRDLPHCRTMIYGYNSKLLSNGIDTIMDYGRELMEEIKKVRNTEEVRAVNGAQLANRQHKADIYDLLAETATTFLHRAQFWRHYTGSCRSLARVSDAGLKQHHSVLSRQSRQPKTITRQ
jgi:hypothetical protein